MSKDKDHERAEAEQEATRMVEFSQAVLDVWQQSFADVPPELLAPTLVGVACGISEQCNLCECDGCEDARAEIINFIADGIGVRSSRVN